MTATSPVSVSREEQGTSQRSSPYWAKHELVSWMVAYIRQYGLLPTRREYERTRGDGPDERTIRLRFGSWKQGWRTALQEILNDRANQSRETEADNRNST